MEGWFSPVRWITQEIRAVLPLGYDLYDNRAANLRLLLLTNLGHSFVQIIFVRHGHYNMLGIAFGPLTLRSVWQFVVYVNSWSVSRE